MENEVRKGAKKTKKKGNIPGFFVFLLIVTILLYMCAGAIVAYSYMTGKKEGITADVLYYEGGEPVVPSIPVERDPAVLPLTDDAGEKYLANTLFIGDSNYARIVLYDLLGLDQVIGIEGMGVQSVPEEKCVYFVGQENPVTIPTAVKMMQPRRIVLNFGTNNLIPKNADNFIKNYELAVKSLQDAYPYADIIVQSIPALGENRENSLLTMDVVDEYNERLRDMCNRLDLRFLNFTDDVLKGSNGWIKSSYIYSDGIHLEKDALKQLLIYVRTHEYATEDTRPALTSIPKRRAAPKKEEPKFDPKKTVEEAIKLFKEGTYIEFEGEESEELLKTATTYTFKADTDVKKGDEEKVAKAIYNAVDPKVTVKTKTKVKITYKKEKVTENGKEVERYVFSIQVLPNCEHTFGEWKTEDGIKSRTCSKCGYVEKKKDQDNCEHTFGDWMTSKPATETEEGLKKRVCSKCEYTEEQAIPATGSGSTEEPHTHTYGDWVTTKEPTTEEAGSKSRTCSGCGDVETASIPKLDPPPTPDPDPDPTPDPDPAGGE